MIRRGVPPALATGAICRRRHARHPHPAFHHVHPLRAGDGTSIGRLFLAGVVPGIILVLLFSVWAWFATLVARRELIVVDEHFTLKEKMEGMVRVAPFLGIIAAIGYFMYGGFATPSEIAAIGAFLALVMVMVIYRAYKPADLWHIFRDTVRESSMILMIIAAAALFSYMMALLYVSQSSAEWWWRSSSTSGCCSSPSTSSCCSWGASAAVAIILMLMPSSRRSWRPTISTSSGSRCCSP